MSFFRLLSVNPHEHWDRGISPSLSPGVLEVVEVMDFTTSTHRRHWMFTKETLRECSMIKLIHGQPKHSSREGDMQWGTYLYPHKAVVPFFEPAVNTSSCTDSIATAVLLATRDVATAVAASFTRRAQRPDHVMAISKNTSYSLRNPANLRAST